MLDVVRTFEEKQMKKNLPQINVGDKVRIYQKVKEGGKERVSSFEGIVIAMRGSGINRRVTLRKIASSNVGVEKGFLIHHPSVSKIKILKRGHTRRAKLYYLRGLVGKRAQRVKEKGVLAEAIVWEELGSDKKEAVKIEESEEESGEKKSGGKEDKKGPEIEAGESGEPKKSEDKEPETKREKKLTQEEKKPLSQDEKLSSKESENK